MANQYGLGRLHAADPRDAHHPLGATRAALVEPTRETFYWPSQAPLYQNGYSACVGYGWTHWLRTAPLMSKYGNDDAMQLYYDAQKADEWPGEAYDGTSVRAGAKVLEARGLIRGGYRWTVDVEDMRRFVLNTKEGSPIVIGIDITTSMFTPDKFGFIEPIGADEGGHCMLVVGFSKKRDAFRILNSWHKVGDPSHQWGEQGRCWMKRDAMADRMGRPWAEACVGFEAKPALAAA